MRADPEKRVAQVPLPDRSLGTQRAREPRAGVSWGRVEWTAAAAVICGQGPSFADVDLAQLRRIRDDIGAVVIAVNGAINHIPWADYYFTLDPDRRHLRRLDQRQPGVRYVVAVPPEYGTPSAIHDHAVSPPQGVTYLRRVQGKKLSEDPGEIVSGNSAYGALGLSYLMGARRVVLLGVDGRGLQRWDGTRNNDLSHLPALFARALPQLRARGIEVVNGSLRSAIECFPTASPAKALNWLAGQIEIDALHAAPTPPGIDVPGPARTDIALVLGGAECVWDDVAELERMIGHEWDGLVVAANDIGAHWPRRLDHWVTLHPEKLESWIELRRKFGYPDGYTTWAHQRLPGYTVRGWGLVDRTVPRRNSSGLLATFVVPLLGARAVLCGIPVTRTPHFSASTVHVRARPWTSADSHWRHFQEAADELRTFARSMSGRTADLLGRPDAEWLAPRPPGRQR